jgi:hypothetical protein
MLLGLVYQTLYLGLQHRNRLTRIRRAWRLLGSNDRGLKPGRVLDVRTNQLFKFRSQHLSFRVQNPAAYNTYRLQIEAGNYEDMGICMSIELAELRLDGPLTNAASEADLQSGHYRIFPPSRARNARECVRSGSRQQMGGLRPRFFQRMLAANSLRDPIGGLS